MKTLILIFGCLMLSVISSQAAEEQHQQNQQQLKNPNRQLEEIEKYITSLRQRVETYYTDQLIELKQRAEAEIRLLEVADKAVYVRLAEQAEVAKAVLHIDNYGYQAPSDLVDETERMLQFKDEREDECIDNYGYRVPSYLVSETERTILWLKNRHEPYGGFEDNFEKSPKRFAVAQSLIAERKSRILAKLEQGAADLERQKKYALTVTLPELEKRLKQELTKPEAKPTHGLVAGIVYCAKPSAIVDRQIVHEGDVIYGVTVVKISKDNVKFSKNGKNWEQKVQQSPEVYWK